MARNFVKYSALGEGKIERNDRYSLTVSELHLLIDNVSNVSDLYNSITMAYAAGIEAGHRMARRGKE